MDQRAIGRLTVSVVGLGCNNLGTRIDAEASRAVVEAALDAGVTLFDTADIYGRGASEEILGRVLAPVRDEVVIATKFGGPMRDDDPGAAGASPRWVRQAVTDSLRRLGTDRIDLYQLHFPDDSVPIAETLGVLEELVAEGKVIEYGCSNFDGPRLREAAAAADETGARGFVSVQNHYSLLHRRGMEADGTYEAVLENDLAVLPYFPLASGLLTGKYRPGAPPPPGTRLAGMPPDRQERMLSEDRLRTVERLERFAAQRGRSLLELAVSWLLARPNLASVIAGATTPDQVRSNVAAAGWALTGDDLAAIDEICPPGG